MGAYQEVDMEGGGGARRLGKVLLRGIPGGDTVCGGDVGAIRTNVAEVRGNACGFSATGKKVKVKEAEGRVVEEGGGEQSTSGI